MEYGKIYIHGFTIEGASRDISGKIKYGEGQNFYISVPCTIR